MMAARVNFILAFLACSAFGADLNVRYLTATTAISQAEVPSSVPLRWYQGESLTFDHWSTAGGTNAADWSGTTNLSAIWSVVADRLDDPRNTNIYLWATGALTAASGKVRFTAPPSWSAMPASNYWSFITLYQTDPSGITNQAVGVVQRSAVQVQQRETGTAYVGPWQIPSNMVDGVARAWAQQALAQSGSAVDATARSNTAALGAAIAILGPATTNAGVDATNALAIARAAYTAATNAQAVAFSALLLAQGKVSGTDWSNMLAAVSTTGTWYYAESAGAITVSNGLVRLGITADNLVFSQVTNTVNVYVSAVSSTNQAAYNGPAERTQWTMLSENAFGVFYNTSAGFDLVYDKQLVLWQVYPHEDYNTRWEPITTTSLFVCPTVLIGSDTSLGLLTLSWASATNVITIPMSTLASENLLAVDSLAYTDIGPWVNGSATNGSAALATLGFYAGYAWAGLYTQYTNGQQGRVFAASIAAPSFRDAKLAGMRFLFRGYNIADSVDVLIYDAGASSAWYTNTLNVDTSEVVHVYSVSGFNRAAAPGMTLQATVKTTAETTAGTWTALPRVEATWTK